MEIDNSRLAPATVSAKDQGAPVDQHGKGSEKTASESSQPATSTADRVSLTDEARRLRELEAVIANQPVDDSQRVNEIRNAIENGTFKVNPERIAEKLLSLEQAITGAR